MRIYTASQMKQADRNAAERFGLPLSLLMHRAATALLKECLSMLPQPQPVAILCGPGNNGGDGMCLGRLLSERGYQTAVIRISDAVSPETLDAVRQAALVVDCMFGTGFRGDLPEELHPLLGAAEGKRVLACDLPSGVECDTGRTDPRTLRAEVTVTFGAFKPCFFLYPAKEYCGRVTVADIGLPPQAFPQEGPRMETVTEDTVRALLRPRPENSHKGTFGSLQAVCGSEYMTGAAVLAASAALRTGVGLLYLSLPDSIRPILQGALPEPVYTPRLAETPARALLIGCGMTPDREPVEFYLKQKKPMVLDADAVNVLAAQGIPDLPEGCILTPHPGEFARLTGQTAEQVEADRLGAALAFTSAHPCVLVLKGHHTVIAQGRRAAVNTSGNSALAKGGSGDVLAGLIAGFLAQGYSPWDSALCGVFLHGKAAQQGSKIFSEAGLLPSQLPELVARQIAIYTENR